jgi:hypothetical protein
MRRGQTTELLKALKILVTDQCSKFHSATAYAKFRGKSLIHFADHLAGGVMRLSRKYTAHSVCDNTSNEAST